MPDATVIEAAVAAPPEGVTEAFNRDAVERLLEGAPAWLKERRLRAWSAYERTPLPTTHLEQWRYTDLRRRLKLDGLRLPAGEVLPGDPARWPVKLRTAMEEDQDASGHLVLANGRVVHVDLRADLVSGDDGLISAKPTGQGLERFVVGGDPAAIGLFAVFVEQTPDTCKRVDVDAKVLHVFLRSG